MIIFYYICDIMIHILSHDISLNINNYIMIEQGVGINVQIYIVYGNHDLYKHLTITLIQTFKEYISILCEKQY